MNLASLEYFGQHAGIALRNPSVPQGATYEAFNGLRRRASVDGRTIDAKAQGGKEWMTINMAICHVAHLSKAACMH
jgi:hypothetical protein